MKRIVLGLVLATVCFSSRFVFAADSYTEGTTRTASVGEVIYGDTLGSHPSTYYFAGLTDGGKTLVLRKKVLTGEKITEYFDLFIPVGSNSSYTLTLPTDWLGDIRTPGVRIVGQADAAFPGGAVLTFGVDNYERLLMLVDRAPKKAGIFD